MGAHGIEIGLVAIGPVREKPSNGLASGGKRKCEGRKPGAQTTRL